MHITEKEMRRYILNYCDNIKDIDQLKRLQDYNTKVTASYDFNGGGMGGGRSSKVENFVVSNEREFKKLKQTEFEIDIVENSLLSLKGKQKKVMDLYIFNNKLTQIRDRLHIKSKSAVWNIKERAIKNMVKYANNNTKINN